MRQSSSEALVVLVPAYVTVNMTNPIERCGEMWGGQRRDAKYV